MMANITFQNGDTWIEAPSCVKNIPPKSGASASIPCLKYQPEWQDEEWWFEIAFYTDSSFDIEVSRYRFDDADCQSYSFVIGENGQIDGAYEGYPPFHPTSKRLKPWVGTAIFFGSMGALVAGTIVGVVIWKKRR